MSCPQLSSRDLEVETPRISNVPCSCEASRNIDPDASSLRQTKTMLYRQDPSAALFVIVAAQLMIFVFANVVRRAITESGG